ncbi:MAG: N-acetylglucosaminidase [Anaerorhabdus sp.]
MKKNIIKFICLAIILSMMPIFDNPVYHANASEEYPLFCGTGYEVSNANSNGTFTKISCASNFTSAKTTMNNNGDDAVVRHISSKSPMKIIAMNKGLAITYPARSNSSTLNIYQDVNNSNKKSTYVTKHREMKYYETYSYDNNGSGQILVNITGFKGTTSLKDVDLVPYAFLGNNVTVLLGGNDASSQNEQPFWTHVYQSNYTVVQNGNYKDLVFKAYSGWSGPSTYPSVFTMVVGSAPDWMNVGDTYYSYDGYNFYSDTKHTKLAGKYFNYYQFLPARSKTSVSADSFNRYLVSKKGSNTNSKMKNQGQVFINAQNKYGVNALLVYALACLESAYGTSNYAINRNNLFGWNAFDSDPGQASYFSSIEEAVNEHMGINLRGYLNIEDWRFFGSHFGNKGSGFNVKYASDPYWGYKIAAIAYEIDKFANNYDGKLSDDKNLLGLVNKYGVDVKVSENSSNNLYNTAYGATYQENFTKIVLDVKDKFIKVQSTNPVVNGKIINGSTKGLVSYDWANSVGFISKENITLLNGEDSVVEDGIKPTGDHIFNVDKISNDDGILKISGVSYRPGIYVNSKNSVKQTLSLVDQDNKSIIYDSESNISDNDKVQFSVNVELKDLEIGEYYFKLNTEYSRFSEYSAEYLLRDGKIEFEKFSANDKDYSISIVDEKIVLSVKEAKKDVVVTNSLQQDIISFEYDKETNELSIIGYAFISDLNATKDSDILHRVYLVDQETQEEIELDTQSIVLDKPISFNDGYEYSKVKFKATTNLVDELVGNYSINILVKNGDITKKSELKNYFNQIKPETIIDGDLQYRFVINQMYGYRYEIQIENSQVDFTQVSKPSTRNSMFDFNNLIIEDGVLQISGVAWIYGADANNNTKPEYELLLVDQSGKVSSNTLNTGKCSIDYSEMLSLDFDTSKACFSGEYDLNKLEKNKYRMYLKIKTKDYLDIFELYDFYNREIENSNHNLKVFSIGSTDIRNRLILEIN